MIHAYHTPGGPLIGSLGGDVRASYPGKAA